jgi:hypothetical protein
MANEDHDFSKDLQCAISHDQHFVEDPIVLECNDWACRECLLKQQNQLFQCRLCQKTVDKNVYTENNMKAFKTMFKLSLDKLFSMLDKKISIKREKLKDMIKSKQEKVYFLKLSNIFKIILILAVMKLMLKLVLLKKNWRFELSQLRMIWR